MEQSPDPFDRKTISRAGIAGAVLAVLGIALFMGIYIAFGNLGVDPFIRLISALCIPPAVIAAIIGGYMLVVRPRGN
jgi:hypothetical protein